MLRAMPKKSNKSMAKYSENVLMRLEVGTLARVDGLLEKFEGRTHMLREAIEREIKRRERKQRAR